MTCTTLPVHETLARDLLSLSFLIQQMGTSSHVCPMVILQEQSILLCPVTLRECLETFLVVMGKGATGLEAWDNV